MRRHRFEDVDVLFEEPLDRVDASQRFGGIEEIVGTEPAHHGIELVQNRLEPQFID